jgi:hypothetical protein
MPETVVHFQIRIPPDIHERLASWAKEDKRSLNMLVVGVLERAVASRNGEPVGAGASNGSSQGHK